MLRSLAGVSCVVLAMALGIGVPQFASSSAEGQSDNLGGKSTLAYGDVSGILLKNDVDELTKISHRSETAENQYWGRISGTTADQETEKWLLDRFETLGLKDVHIQQFSLPPQWFPTLWKVAASDLNTTVELTSIQPVLGSPGTAGVTVSADAVYVGLGSSMEFAGRDVKNRAVVISTVPAGSIVRHSAAANGAITRAIEKGASVIILIVDLPGNARSQLETAGGSPPTVPTFSLGAGDGAQLLGMMERSKVTLRVRLTVEQRAGLATGSVWGVLPGTSDEQILIIAHHDSYFEGADDNATGLVTLLGLARHFAQQSPSDRRRTITFVATPGHHSGMLGVNWLRDHMDFARTALIINCEHTASRQTYVAPIIDRMNGPQVGTVLLKSNVTAPRWWYVGGSSRLRQLTLDAFQDFGVGILDQPEPVPLGELWALYQKAPSLQLIEAPLIYHTDLDRSDMVLAEGLEHATQAFANIIDMVNQFPLQALRAVP